MPYTIQTKNFSLDLSEDSLLGVLVKCNIVESTLRHAGLNPADICLCPAVKLSRNLRTLEENLVTIPDSIEQKSIGVAKTLTDLPDELLLECHRHVSTREQERDDSSDWWFDDSITDRDGWEASIRYATRDVRLLQKILYNFGTNQHLRQIVLDGCKMRALTQKVYVQSILDALWDSRYGVVGRNTEMLSWNGISNGIEVINEAFRIHDPSRITAIDDFLDTVTLFLPLQCHNLRRCEIFLATNTSSLRLQHRTEGPFEPPDAAFDPGDYKDYGTCHPEVKNILINTCLGAHIRDHPSHPDGAEHSAQEIARLSQLDDLFPSLQSLTVTIHELKWAAPIFSGQNGLEQAIGIVRQLRPKYKVFAFSDDDDISYSSPETTHDGTQMSDKEVADALIAHPLRQYTL